LDRQRPAVAIRVSYAIVCARYISPRAIIAQAIRAVLLARVSDECEPVSVIRDTAVARRREGRATREERRRASV